MPAEFWRVYNYLALQWFETEYGRIAESERWYQPAMAFLEDLNARQAARV